MSVLQKQKNEKNNLKKNPKKITIKNFIAVLVKTNLFSEKTTKNHKSKKKNILIST